MIRVHRVAWGFMVLLLSAAAVRASLGSETVLLDRAMTPPEWAFLERAILDANSVACSIFHDRYFDDRGFAECVERWGGDDGPDDASESFAHWPLLHALGAPDRVLELYKRIWEGHLRQFTRAATEEVPLARDGMYYREFPTQFDWLHHNEGLRPFLLQGLSDPLDRELRRRMIRFADFYTGEDPTAPNYDPKHRIIRSLINGSRGPLLREATALDWAGDPIEVEGRFALRHGERNYDEMLAHFRDYTDVIGDHPQNLASTSLALNAFLLSGDPKYRDWLLEYVDAWVDRMDRNGGIIPSKVGLDGAIGGADGKWYAGVYGWAFSVEVPQAGAIAHRNTHHLALIGFGNALLLTGDQRYVDVWRRMGETINARKTIVNGTEMYPTMYGDEGWYAHTPNPYHAGALETYYWSMNPADRERVDGSSWLEYLEGRAPDYPVAALRRELDAIRQAVQAIQADPTTPDTRLSDDILARDPIQVGALTELMLGGLPTGNTRPVLHCRLRYFDPERRRAGLPSDVAALVDGMTGDEVTVTLVNLDQTRGRNLVLQGGAFGEHRLVSIYHDGREIVIDGPTASVRLAPGSGGRLRIEMDRYALTPSLDAPWNRP